jgi:hypothetical protein
MSAETIAPTPVVYGLQKRFGQLEVLKGLSLTVREGELCPKRTSQMLCNCLQDFPELRVLFAQSRPE